MDLVLEDTSLSVGAYVQLLARYIHRQHMPASVNLKSFNPKPRYLRPDRLVSQSRYRGLLKCDSQHYSLPQLNQAGLVVDPYATYYQYEGDNFQILTHLKDPYNRSYWRFHADAPWIHWCEPFELAIAASVVEKELKHLDC